VELRSRSHLGLQELAGELLGELAGQQAGELAGEQDMRRIQGKRLGLLLEEVDLQNLKTGHRLCVQIPKVVEDRNPRGRTAVRVLLDSMTVEGVMPARVVCTARHRAEELDMTALQVDDRM
jgi:hypothetical protein